LVARIDEGVHCDAAIHDWYSIGARRAFKVSVKGDVLLCKLEGLPDMSIRIT
jgi:hypothetical protein